MLHELHPRGDNAAWRAGLLARELGAWLRIVHAGRFSDAGAARERLAPLAWRLQEHLQVPVLAQAFRSPLARELASAAQDADLVVMCSSGMEPLRATRLAGRPTLVVRTPATVPYRRVLACVDADDDARHAAALARTLADGKEWPATTPLQSAAALLERERTLFPDLVMLPCSRAPSLARRFLVLTQADTLLLPAPAAAGDPADARRSNFMARDLAALQAEGA